MCDMCPTPPPEKWSIKELRETIEHLQQKQAYNLSQNKEYQYYIDEYRHIIRKRFRKYEK